MLVTIDEILIYIGKSTSVTEAERELISLIHRPVERALQNYIQKELGRRRHVEYLPVGDDLKLDNRLADFEYENGRAVASMGVAGSDRLQLTHAPVISTGMEVYEDTGANAGHHPSSAFPASSLLTFGSDYWPDTDSEYDVSGDVGTKICHSGVLFRSGYWPREPRSVKVLYYGGWDADQLMEWAEDIRLAVIKSIATEFWKVKHGAQNQGAGPLTSESIGKWSGSYATNLSSLGAPQLICPESQHILEHYRDWGRLFG
jgi:hypothetical protein